MAFKDLHKLKKVQEVKMEQISLPFLVVGHDLFAVDMYLALVEKHGPENVKLLCSEKLVKEDLKFRGPHQIRGTVNCEIFKKYFNHYPYSEVTESAQFYKDMQFKSFSGRSKSETLLKGEEFYTTGYISINEDELFPFLKIENLLEQLNQNALLLLPKEIEKNDTHWKIVCTNGTEIVSENVYWGLGPNSFLNLYKDKGKLSNKLIEFCESFHTHGSLLIKMTFDRPITDMKETVFIPLSYTHEWGHFVGDFKQVDRKQQIEFMHFVDKDHSSEEDISREIRLLKKNMEKIFPKYKANETKEFISLEDQGACLKIDDRAFGEVENQLNNLKFISINAPFSMANGSDSILQDSCGVVTHALRGLICSQDLKKSL